jgi:xanthine dehydrogenase accessory factor
MEAGGFTEQELTHFQSPMGLDIGALTPREIAVSIVGKLIAVRRGMGAR